jgi:hypothetical protein
MRRVCATATGMTAALLLAGGSAFAFEESPAAPTPEAVPVTPETKAPVAELQSPAPGSAPSLEKSGAKLFGFSLLPKLDFGLELLYSQPQSTELQQGPLSDENGNLTVLGTVKRHF